MSVKVYVGNVDPYISERELEDEVDNTLFVLSWSQISKGRLCLFGWTDSLPPVLFDIYRRPHLQPTSLKLDGGITSSSAVRHCFFFRLSADNREN